MSGDVQKTPHYLISIQELLFVKINIYFCEFKQNIMYSLQSNSVQSQPQQKHSQSTLNPRGSQGGLLRLPEESLNAYLEQLFSLENQNYELKPGVARLQKLINQDTDLRSRWQHGFSFSKKLRGKKGNQVIKAINHVLYTPPSYNKSQFVGFPINAIFLDFMQTENGRTFFSNQQVNAAIKDILIQYSEMVSGPQSVLHLHAMQPKGWFCQSACKKINYSEYLQYDTEKPYFGFNSWNAWFLRTFKPEMRPVGYGTPMGVLQQNVIVNSCQSTPLIYPEQPVRNVKHTDSFWLKDDKYSLVDMFSVHGTQKGYPYLFQDGTVYQAYLSPYNYHHWHAPVDGQIMDIYSIPGTYYLTQSHYLNRYDPLSPNESQTFLSAAATRLVIVIKADNPKIGYIAIIYIGMTEVSSCVPSRQKGQKVRKGDHIGNFAYGGSTHAMIFQKTAKITFCQNLYTCQNGVKEPCNQKLASYLAHVN